MKTLFIILLIILILLALTTIIISTILSFKLSKPKVFSYEYATNYMKDLGTYNDYDQLIFDEYIVKTRDNYSLHARYFKSDNPSNKFVIMLHGYTANQILCSAYINTFRRLNFNVITYDERYHGKNERTICSFGVKESLDFIDVIDDTYKRFGSDIYVGCHGESMGASTIINSFRYTPNIKFAVCDCPYGDLKRTLYRKLKELHIPRFIISLTGIINRILFGYNPFKIKPEEEINNSTIPLLLIHGTKDQIVKHYESEIIYNNYNSYRELVLVDNAIHAYSFRTDRVYYDKRVEDFLNNIVFF